MSENEVTVRKASKVCDCGHSSSISSPFLSGVYLVDTAVARNILLLHLPQLLGTMIFTVGIVVVNGEAFVDPRLDTSTPVIRDIVSETARDQDSFEFLTVEIVPRGTEEISNAVRNMIERNSLNLVLVVGGIGFEESDCTPEVRSLFRPKKL